MLHVSIVGCGAIGAGVLALVDGDGALQVDSVIVPPHAIDRTERACATLQRPPRVLTAVPDGAGRPDLLVECAGHAALSQHVVPALAHGIPCLVASVGALSTPGLVEQLEAAAREGHTQVQLLSGAIGAIDAIAAAKVGGLETVAYTGRKPPQAWRDTPAEQVCDLDAITEPTVLFRGSAREAALLYPKNANVAATVSLAGLGLDATEVTLIADPAISENVHHIEAHGAFGQLELTMRGRPLAANPKTSALTVYSVVRALANRSHALAI